METAPFFGPARSRASAVNSVERYPHIRHAGLDHGGKADAVKLAGGTCRVAAALEIVEPAIPIVVATARA